MRSIDEIIKDAHSYCINANGDAADDLRRFLNEAFAAGQHSMGTLPVKISFVTWDPRTDGVVILHDGELAWQESSYDSLSQYLHNNALVGTGALVTLEVVEADQYAPEEFT